ncbi:12885_t:CDS:2, partial [Funneliformis caledonium]
MATLERVEQELEDAKKRFYIVKERLDRLEELRSGTAQPRWNGEQANLERKEESLEAEKKQSTKRAYDQADLVDNSYLICNGLLQKFETIPTQVNDLQSLINVPLLRKLTVTSDEEIMYPELSDYVCTREEERRSTIAKNISSALASSIDREFSGNKSESMLHYPLDSMIRVPLETFCRFLGNVLPIEIDRDKADSGTTTIGTKRPDFL